jgi:hypothetical protein
MNDPYLILTPLLMLGVLTLARFVGCNLVFHAEPDPESKFVVVATALGDVRNDFTGWVGMAFVVGPEPIRVTELGRTMLIATTQPHDMKIVRPSGQGGVDVGLATIPPSAALADFAYATLTSPVILNASQRYYVVSHEQAGGDSWRDVATVVATTNAAQVTSGVSNEDPGPIYTLEGSAGNTFGPVDFKYSVES